jgi:exosortase
VAAAAEATTPLPRPALLALAALAVAVVASYLPSFRQLAAAWENPNYSHGWLVIPIAAMILWVRRDDLARTAARPSPFGWLALLALLGLRVVLYDRNEMWIEQATIPLVAASLVLALGGWRVLWVALPAVAFLFFLLPLPPSVNATLANPLQTLATIGSATLLQVAGLPVLCEGHQIVVGTNRLEVARACNGLSMLVSFVTLITATVLTVARDRPIWERAVLLVSAVPIALVANILRIALTAGLQHAFGPKTELFWPLSLAFPDMEHLTHDAAGWLVMMPMALLMIFLEMKVLSWLVVEEKVAPRRALFIPAAAGGPPVSKPKP